MKSKWRSFFKWTINVQVMIVAIVLVQALLTFGTFFLLDVYDDGGTLFDQLAICWLMANGVLGFFGFCIMIIVFIVDWLNDVWENEEIEPDPQPKSKRVTGAHR